MKELPKFEALYADMLERRPGTKADVSTEALLCEGGMLLPETSLAFNTLINKIYRIKLSNNVGK